MEKIALLPGGFKPPHAGHYNMAKWLASNTDADTVVIKVGAKERDGITREMSLKLWDLYRSTDPDPLAKKLTILPSDSNSPVKDVYDFIEQDAPERSTIYLGMGEKDSGDARFANIGKFAEPKGITFKTVLVPPQAGGVSGTEMRTYIKKNNFSDFRKYIPDHLTAEQTNEAWAIAIGYTDYSPPKGGTQSTNLGEDFYDPKNKYYDFAKSNVPGPKKDIPRKGDQIHNRQTNPHSHMSEMMGTMNNQEKAKHAKNLKRLSKDLIKINKGNQYVKVPEYLKGTLKRKLYESTASIHGKFIPLETMDTPTKQVQGMIGRDKLKGGMVFPYDNVAKRDFHMKNCKIPLDIIFIINNKISKIHHNCPPCKENNCPNYSGKADTVLELPGNYCKKHNINIGDHIGINYNELPEPLLERDLSDKEERIAQSLPDKEFKKRYGKDWKSVKIATATKMAKKNENYPPYKADQVQKVRYQASDTFTNSPKQAKKMGYLEGDTYEKMAAKGKKKGNLKQGTVRKRLKIKAGDKIPLSRINKAISRIKKMKNPSEKNKKFLKALNLAKTLKTTTHKENINEADPKKGTGKKPKGSGRRLYTDENPKDTVKVKFSTRQDIVDTLSKKSFKSKSHKRQSQIINLIHQRVRAALGRTKDPQKKKRLRSAFDYIKKRKEASKKKTQRMKKEGALTKNWWKNIISEMLLVEGGAAGHMAHPFNLSNVNSGKDLKDIFTKSSESLNKTPGSVKIDGVNSSVRLVDLDGKKQFVMDRGSKKPLDIKGITKADLEDRFKPGHGMVKIGGEVLDMFNEALPSLENDLKKLGAYDDPNILFNMEYVSGKTNVQDYGSNFIAIHGLNKIESKEVQGARKMLTKRVSSEIPYDKSALQSLLDNLKPVAEKNGFEVYGSVPTEMKKKPNFNAALSKTYTVKFNDEDKTQSLDNWLNELDNIPEKDFIFIDVNGVKKKVGAVSKQVYQAILNGGNVDEMFGDDKDKAIKGFTTYLATEKLGDEILKVLDSPMGTVDNHEGVVIRDNKIAKVPFKITGKFILGGIASDFK